MISFENENLLSEEKNLLSEESTTSTLGLGPGLLKKAARDSKDEEKYALVRNAKT